MRIEVSKECVSKGIFVKHTEVIGVNNGKGTLETELREVEEKFRKTDPASLKDVPTVRVYRDFYWSLGIDPTKTRPSGEALRRRIARSGKLPRINDIVDAGNVVSASTLISIGIYDLKKISGEPRITLSSGGEKFYGIGNKSEVLPPGIPIMVDGVGNVMHIFPHRDSIITSVSDSTRDVLIVGAGVRGIAEREVEEAVKETARLLSNLGGKVVHDIC